MKEADRIVARKGLEDASNPPQWLRNRVAEVAKRLRVAPDQVEVLGWAPMLHAGWECHSAAVLARLPGGCIRWVVVDDVGDGRFPVVDMLRERLAAYHDAIAATEQLLALAAQHERIEDALDDDAEWLGVEAQKGNER